MRRMILIGWLVAIVAAVPFAMKQTDHLSSGGFGVPGSQSKAVDDQLERFPGISRDQLAFLLKARDPSGVDAALARLRRLVAATPHVQLGGRTRRTAEVVLVPLKLTGTREQSANIAVDLYKAVDPGVERGGVATYMGGQEALWAGMQDVSKEQFASSERVGFPIVLMILLAVFGSIAAAMLPLALGFASVLVTGAV